MNSISDKIDQIDGEWTALVAAHPGMFGRACILLAVIAACALFLTVAKERDAAKERRREQAHALTGLGQGRPESSVRPGDAPTPAPADAPAPVAHIDPMLDYLAMAHPTPEHERRA